MQQYFVFVTIMNDEANRVYLMLIFILMVQYNVCTANRQTLPLHTDDNYIKVWVHMQSVWIIISITHSFIFSVWHVYFCVMSNLNSNTKIKHTHTQFVSTSWKGIYYASKEWETNDLYLSDRVDSDNHTTPNCKWQFRFIEW